MNWFPSRLSVLSPLLFNYGTWRSIVPGFGRADCACAARLESGCQGTRCRRKAGWWKRVPERRSMSRRTGSSRRIPFARRVSETRTRRYSSSAGWAGCPETRCCNRSHTCCSRRKGGSVWRRLHGSFLRLRTRKGHRTEAKRHRDWRGNVPRWAAGTPLPNWWWVEIDLCTGFVQTPQGRGVCQRWAFPTRPGCSSWPGAGFLSWTASEHSSSTAQPCAGSPARCSGRASDCARVRSPPGAAGGPCPSTWHLTGVFLGCASCLGRSRPDLHLDLRLSLLRPCPSARPGDLNCRNVVGDDRVALASGCHGCLNVESLRRTEAHALRLAHLVARSTLSL